MIAAAVAILASVVSCPKEIPYRPPDRATAIRLRPHLRVGHSVEEAPSACVTRDGRIYFGLGFYEGEGADGIGGVGMYDPATKKLQVRRPPWLRDKSVTAIAHDGKALWLGVMQEYEKSNMPHGLARYHWATDTIEPMRGEDAPCGFTVGTIAVREGVLSVTTDLGLSRLDLATGKWTHQRPCREVYRRLLAAKPPSFPEDESVAERIARFDPEVVRELLLARDPKTWHWSETPAVGTILRDFGELRRYVLEPVPRTSEARRAAIRAFAEQKHREPAWRDFAIQYARVYREPEVLRWFRGDPKVFDFLVQQGAVEVLPWIDARRAIPVLLRVMNTTDDPSKLAVAIEAIERAAHLRIEPDGARVKLAANSDTPEYADEEFGAFRRWGTDVASLRKIVAHWRVWSAAAMPPL